MQMNKTTYAKPKESFDGLRKGNLYEIIGILECRMQYKDQHGYLYERYEKEIAILDGKYYNADLFEIVESII